MSVLGSYGGLGELSFRTLLVGRMADVDDNYYSKARYKFSLRRI